MLLVVPIRTQRDPEEVLEIYKRVLGVLQRMLGASGRVPGVLEEVFWVSLIQN